MNNFSEKSANSLKQLGLNNSQINSLSKSKTFVQQLNEHMTKATIYPNSKEKNGFDYDTPKDYGDIHIHINHNNSIDKLDTLIHEIGHANNLDLVHKVDFPKPGEEKYTNWKTGADLTMSEYVYATMLNEGAAEYNKNQILYELNEQGLLKEFSGLSINPLYNPNDSKENIIQKLGQEYFNSYPESQLNYTTGTKLSYT